MSEKLYMFFDTETTGLSDFKAAYNAPQQPNIIQLGYQVTNSMGQIIFEKGCLVNTTALKDWKGIHPEAQAVHKISEDMVNNYGLDPSMTLDEFIYWADKCDMHIAHNNSFDIMIMQCFAYRLGNSPDIFPTEKAFCTMKTTTQICKVPNVGRGGFKWPKLVEAYCSLVDRKGFRDAHNALADVNACREIFFALKNRELITHANI